MLRGSTKEAVRRLEEMKQATILRYLSNINLEKDSDLYDEMMVHFANGELNDYFSSSVLDALEEDDRENVCELANEFISLCFYMGESDYWSDSIDCVSNEDYELIALKIFDNYDFLLEVARDGKREALEQMKSFADKNGYTENSVLDLLRNTFNNDQLLKTVLVEMSNEDSLYDVFTTSQKAELCRFPEGTVFIYDDGEVALKNPLEVARALIATFDGEDYSDASLSEIKKMLAKLPADLVVEYISDDYIGEYGHYIKNEEISQKKKSMR